MEKINLTEKMDELNYTMETRPFVFGKKRVNLDVYEIPLEFLSYNKNNGRIFLGVNEKEKHGVDFNDMSLEEYNEEIEQLIWEYDEQKNIDTKSSIEDIGQLEIALVGENGVVIDGNRRFTCLRRLHRENPERFKHLKACIVTTDGEITPKDIKKYELNVQFGKETQADYHLTDKVMSIYREVKDETLSLEEIADQMNISKNKVHNFVITAETINLFLDYFMIPEKYFIIDKFKYVGPIETIAKYINKGKVIQSLSETEIIARRNICFDILVGLKLSYPTQDIRDTLIRDIYSKNPDICDKFISEYDEQVAPLFFELMRTGLESGDFYDFKNIIKDTDATISMKRVYEKYKDLSNIQNTLDGQIDLANKALEAIRNIDVAMFENTNKPEIQDVFRTVKDILKKADAEIKGITYSDE